LLAKFIVTADKLIVYGLLWVIGHRVGVVPINKELGLQESFGGGDVKLITPTPIPTREEPLAEVAGKAAKDHLISIGINCMPSCVDKKLEFVSRHVLLHQVLVHSVHQFFDQLLGLEPFWWAPGNLPASIFAIIVKATLGALGDD
jgi:hypothetical protein